LAIFEGMHLIGLTTKIRIFGTVSFMAVPAILIHLNIIHELIDIALALALARAAQIVISIAVARNLELISSSGVSYELVIKFTGIGKWLTISNIMSIGMTHSDRFILGHYRPPTELVNYAVASELIQRGIGVLSIISSSLFPLISRSEFSEVQEHRIKKAFRISLALGILGGLLGYWLVDYLLIIWLGRNDTQQIAYLFKIMLTGWFASGLGQLYLAKIHSLGDTRTPAIIHTVEATFFVPLAIYVAVNYGAVGAALAWTARAITDAVILRYYSNKI